MGAFSAIGVPHDVLRLTLRMWSTIQAITILRAIAQACTGFASPAMNRPQSQFPVPYFAEAQGRWRALLFHNLVWQSPGIPVMKAPRSATWPSKCIVQFISPPSDHTDRLRSCPVCGQVLSELGLASLQEAHIKSCLDGGGRSPSGRISDAGRYIVYKLPSESSLIGDECGSNHEFF